MPGLCLRFDPHDALAEVRRRFRSTVESLEHLEEYRSEIALDDERVQLGYTRYPGYPVRTYENGTHLVYVEGEAYDRDFASRELLAAAPELLSADDDTVAGWVRQTDGDFLLVAFEKRTGDLAVVNDLFGRLPLYCFQRGDAVLLAREPRFVLASVDDVEFDSLGVAQYLLFEYALDGRTLWSGIRKLDPATRVTLRDSGERSFVALHSFDFGNRPRGRSLEENAAALADRFVESCRNRARRSERTIVSLSGGHDSRAVAAALEQADVPFTAVTWTRGHGTSAEDAKVARQVARTLGVDWERYELSSRMCLDDASTLLALKGGLNSIQMSYLTRFFDELCERHSGDLTHFTGDGGDKLLPSLRTTRSFRSLDDLVEYTISNHAIFPPEEATALTGLSESRLVDSVRRVLASYPESDLGDRYVGFLARERALNWLFEAEDRNRCYCWTVSPYYSPDLFEYAMGVPDEQKSGDRLYRAFLSELWPEATEIENANWGVPMDSVRYTAIMYALDILERYPRLWDLVRSLYRDDVRGRYPEPLASVLADQVRHCPKLSRYLSLESLQRITTDRNAYEPSQLYNLLTLTSTIETHSCETTVRDRLGAVPVE